MSVIKALILCIVFFVSRDIIVIAHDGITDRPNWRDFTFEFEKHIDARLSDMTEETRKITGSVIGKKKSYIGDGVQVGTKFECFEAIAQCEAVRLLGKGGFGEVRY